MPSGEMLIKWAFMPHYAPENKALGMPSGIMLVKWALMPHYAPENKESANPLEWGHLCCGLMVPYNTPPEQTPAGGCSSMVEHQLPKLRTWVRFPSPAHNERRHHLRV